MREMILNEKYWMKTLELQTLLKPFLQVTLALESNKSKLSCLYVYYIWLLNQSASFSTSSLLPSPIPDTIELIRKRWNQIYHPLLTIAYLADPAARHDRPVKIPEKEMKDIETWLFEHYNEKKKTIKVFAELLHLRARAGSFGNELH